MIRTSWIASALGDARFDNATTDASRRRILSALGLPAAAEVADDDLRFAARAIELLVFDLLDDEEHRADLRDAAAQVFQLARTLPRPTDAVEAGLALVELGAFAVLGDRAADFRRLLVEEAIPALPIQSPDWDERVWACILDLWLRLLRKQGWEDIDAVQERVAAMRADQRELEPAFLATLDKAAGPGPAWRLISAYHLAKAAELLSVFLSQGAASGRFDIRQQLEAQFDRAIAAAGRGHEVELETFCRLLAATAYSLVDSSIWTVTRAVNSRVTKFVQALTDRAAQRPIFEMLPPQRKTLREEGLLGSGHRAVVVSLPTSSGKTFIAEFRMLQALNQFDHERGWIAYLAPTRALVNQLAVRLRRDFSPLGISVERVSPALEVDGLEAGLLKDSDPERQFRVLVTTPEKLDLMLRAGWEEKIERPLTLVVVDEAHGLGRGGRGLKLELLLATINRECRYAQFLLLTPFIHNADEIARWLAPDSHKQIELGLEWSPNDRAIMISRPVRGEKRGEFSVQFETQHTSKATLAIPEPLTIPTPRPLGLSWTDASGQGKLAAATAELLRHRGTVIVLAGRPDYTWGIADCFRSATRRAEAPNPDLEHIRRFLSHEMGPDFPLGELLELGVGVHHTGLSDDTRGLVEWLTEQGALQVLVATTTIAQGVNFPVSAVVLASHQYPYGEDMPPEDFWNIAGRAGRVDQGDLGIVALAATSPEKEAALRAFIGKAVGALNSTLIEMVQEAVRRGSLLQLESLSWQPEWSAFLQYLAHTYRQIGDHERFAAEVEQVLRGTLGFQSLRKSHRGWADQLVRGVYNYAERIKGQPLKLVDSTGFSWESVSATLARLSEANIRADVWTPDLFESGRPALQRMMGILLRVPELRKNLEDATGGPQPDGDTLARMVCDWVQGASLTDMASAYFKTGRTTPVDAMAKCCQNVFGRLTQTASWGLAALQSLTLSELDFEKLSEAEQRRLRNLPAKVYYGVNSDEAIALRLVGLPRFAAEPMAQELKVNADEPLSQLRARVRGSEAATWNAALGDQLGETYRRVWTILEGSE